MIDYLDIYTRLYLHIFSDVLVTYYSADGNKTTKKVMLIEINDFDHIEVKDENNFFNLYFFDETMMIESIKPINSNNPIYYNSYISDVHNGNYLDLSKVNEMKEKILGKKELDSSDKEKIENIKKHVRQYLVSIIDFEYNDLFFSEKQKKEFKGFFEILLKGIINYCKKNDLDTELKLVDKGSTSLVYSIGDKIIKIGRSRRNKTIPYCEYVLQPIINKDYYFDDYPIHIEVTQKVIPLKKINDRLIGKMIDDLSDKLESIGLRLNDFHEGNIGVLLSDNKIHYDSIEFDTSDEIVTSIKCNNNLKVRGPGEYVILDLDCLEIEDMEKYTRYLKSLGFDIYKDRIL